MLTTRLARGTLGVALFLTPALLASSGCGYLGHLDGVGQAMCPELGGADALGATFTADARANAKIRAFVQAAKDMAGVSLQIESEAAEACRRMGRDLGMSPADLAPRQEAGGQASGACGALGARIDAMLRVGVSARASVQPPVCQASADAGARCAGACDTREPDCQASCRAHADVQASCTPALVSVQVTSSVQGAAQLAATLQANLPLLLHAELSLGRRLAADAEVVARLGQEMPRIVGQAGARAVACIGGAAEAAASASVRIQVSVRASASVTGRVGASAG